jgi:hypothetical protein
MSPIGFETHGQWHPTDDAPESETSEPAMQMHAKWAEWYGKRAATGRAEFEGTQAAAQIAAPTVSISDSSCVSSTAGPSASSSVGTVGGVDIQWPHFGHRPRIPNFFSGTQTFRRHFGLGQ